MMNAANGMKEAVVHETTTIDDNMLQRTLKKAVKVTIPSVEEVCIFTDDTVIQISNPKVEASIAANTWVVSGTSQTKNLRESLSSAIYHSLGSDNLRELEELIKQLQQSKAADADEDTSTHLAKVDNDDTS